jgi:O-antigen biosynthesis protein WbqP
MSRPFASRGGDSMSGCESAIDCEPRILAFKAANTRPAISKRILDSALAAVLMVVLLPCMLAVAAAIVLTSRGRAIYWSSRVGRNNKLFPMPKFRTMRSDAPQLATHLLTNSQDWITPLGKFLRKTSLDELPQLWSILTGKMSFVGPRPALFNQADLVSQRTSVGVHRLLPGLTGWAQIHGRDELSIEQKVAFDRYYLEHQSLMLDLRIMTATVIRVLKQDGVRQTGDATVETRSRRAA